MVYMSQRIVSLVAGWLSLGILYEVGAEFDEEEEE